MAWLESHQDLRSHPKTARLRRRLGINLPAAVGHLHLLWWWALSYADDGDLSAFDADQIADAAGWEDGNPDEFVRAMIAAGFLDEDLKIHDWWDYAGRLVARRADNAERMRDWRESRVHGTSDPRAAHVRRTPTARAAHVQGLPDQPTNLDTQPTDQTNQPTDRDHPPNPPPPAEGGVQRGDQRRASRSRRRTIPDDPRDYVGRYAGVINH